MLNIAKLLYNYIKYMKTFILFNYENPSIALQDYIFLKPKRGRGLIQELANHLRISQPQMSQLFRGIKNMTIENAIAIAHFFHWSPEETDYWIYLVERERASDFTTKKYFENKMDQVKSKALSIKESFGPHHELNDNDKAEFYSSWLYSAIRLFCSIKNGKTRQQILSSFPEVNPNTIDKVLNFLVEKKLLKKQSDLYVLGENKTFVKRGSPFLKSHLTNWRIRAVEIANNISDEEIMFSAPFSISKKGFAIIRKELQQQIESLSKNLESYGDAEDVICLNIDLYKVLNGI